ncbi:MAG: hypothetical protein HKM93_23625 [Desulfobacteraceae bacterium]|nr:hypothetical protein [Desulfobacteraceae bacterium]
MELFIIRTGDDYIRVLEDGYRVCGMDKASVFPMERLDQAEAHVRELEGSQYPEVRLRRLLITETSFERKHI